MTHFTSPEFAQLKGIRHAFLTKHIPGCNHIYVPHTFDRLGLKGSKEALIRENRQAVIHHAPFPVQQLSVLNQIHSNRAVVIEKAGDPLEEIPADGQVTRQRGIALGVLTADCGPILFADPSNQVIGAAHAGWKGALGGILEATILQMESLGAKRSQIHAILGPCIRQESYEVGLEFVERFVQASPENYVFFKPGAQPSRMQFDLSGYISMRLKQAGVSHVYDIGLDTCADRENFFSFRASTLEKSELLGNIVSLISLEL